MDWHWGGRRRPAMTAVRLCFHSRPRRRVWASLWPAPTRCRRRRHCPSILYSVSRRRLRSPTPPTGAAVTTGTDGTGGGGGATQSPPPSMPPSAKCRRVDATPRCPSLPPAPPSAASSAAGGGSGCCRPRSPPPPEQRHVPSGDGGGHRRRHWPPGRRAAQSRHAAGQAGVVRGVTPPALS